MTNLDSELDFEILTGLCVSTFGLIVGSIGCLAAIANFDENYWITPTAAVLVVATLAHAINRVRQIEIQQNQTEVKKT